MSARPVGPRRPAAIAFLLVAACGTPGVEVALVDSVPYENELESGVLHRVVVRTGGRADTLADVLTAWTPVVAGDSVVYGIRAEESLVVGLFAHDVREGRTRILPPLPEWVSHAVPRIAPDGRHVAYLAQSGTGAGYGAVATLPEGRVIYRGPPAQLLETDAGVEAIEWVDARRFEMLVDMSYLVGGVQRLRGTVDPLRVDVDTVRRGAPRAGS